MALTNSINSNTSSLSSYLRPTEKKSNGNVKNQDDFLAQINKLDTSSTPPKRFGKPDDTYGAGGDAAAQIPAIAKQIIDMVKQAMGGGGGGGGDKGGGGGGE